MFLLIACQPSVEELSGVYIKTPSINTIDTLYLYPNGTYEQAIYYKSGKFFAKNVNKWIIDGHNIDFMDLFLHHDLDLSERAKPTTGRLDKSSLMPSLLPIKGRKIVIDYDRKIYYEKVD